MSYSLFKSYLVRTNFMEALSNFFDRPLPILYGFYSLKLNYFFKNLLMIVKSGSEFIPNSCEAANWSMLIAACIICHLLELVF